MRPTGRQGLNRTAWDLRYEPARLIALRATPPENPHIWEEPRFRGADCGWGGAGRVDELGGERGQIDPRLIGSADDCPVKLLR